MWDNFTKAQKLIAMSNLMSIIKKVLNYSHCTHKQSIEISLAEEVKANLFSTDIDIKFI